jgi:hypothetical protein
MSVNPHGRYPQQPVQITWPWDGDVLNRHDGDETDEGLTITVEGTAPADQDVLVAGEKAKRDGGSFSAEVTLTDPRTTVTATSAGGSDSVRLIYDRHSRRRYRFSVDDNILFLRDLAREQPDSLFDHWYLAFWREMNERFGAKIHINIYYQCPGFILPEMHDQWREEWAANADWLHLSFHALQNEPAWIYRNAPGRRIARDFEMVTDEIERFATLQVTGNTTTVHWAEATREGCVALRERGIERLIALPGLHPDGNPRTSYYLDAPHVRRLQERDAWWDADTDIIFVACDEVVNSETLEAVPQVLDEQAESPHSSEMIELLIHEQYFREELMHYQPEIKDKVIASLEWVSERGYEPCFWCDGMLGNTWGW